jgi:hypothetical protein
MKFRDLTVGQLFRFPTLSPGSNSFTWLCVKVSARKYRAEHDSETVYTVGAINVAVKPE